MKNSPPSPLPVGTIIKREVDGRVTITIPNGDQFEPPNSPRLSPEALKKIIAFMEGSFWIRCGKMVSEAWRKQW